MLCTADDLLAQKAQDAMQSVTDAEVQAGASAYCCKSRCSRSDCVTVSPSA
jgi:hypothetical protein